MHTMNIVMKILKKNDMIINLLFCFNKKYNKM
jgi:hypothetical protein